MVGSTEVNNKDPSCIPHGSKCYSKITTDENGCLILADKCPYWHYDKTIVYHRDLKCAERIAEELENAEGGLCEFADECEEPCWGTDITECMSNVVACDYLGKLDEYQEAAIGEMVKMCGVNMNKGEANAVLS